MDYATHARVIAEDLVRLRRRIVASRIPEKVVDHNLIIGTWNIRGFGEVYKKWSENPGNPKRNLRAMVYIAEIVKHFDVLAIQEVKRDTSGLKTLLSMLGPTWGLIISDVSGGTKGNSERLAFVFDRRRVQLSGLAGEIVLVSSDNSPVSQFDRTPYIVGFQTAGEKFSLLTAHIRYGQNPSDRMGELTALAQHVAKEIRQRAQVGSDESNLIVLGDFNIDDRGSNPLFQAFVSTGLFVPNQLLNLKTTYNTKPKFYDQIAWFMDGLDIPFSEQAGVIDFVGAIYKDLPILQMTYRMSDHFPLWVEFLIDRSTEQTAKVLGIDPAMPDPFASIPD